MRENPKVTPVSCSHLLRVVGTQKWPISMAYVLINLSSRPLNAQKIALLLQNTFSINHRFYNLRFYRVLVWLKGQNDYKSMRYKMNKCAKCAKVWTNTLVYMQSYLLRHNPLAGLKIPCLLLLSFLASFFFYVDIFNRGWTTLKRKENMIVTNLY